MSDTFLTVIVALAVAIAVGSFAARIVWTKKQTSKRLVELANHLNEFGVRTVLLTKNDEQPRIENRDFWRYTSRSKDILEIKGKGINYIFVDCLMGKNVTYYYLNYVVQSTIWLDSRPIKGARLVKKRRFLFVGKVLDIEWRGDESLANILNSDYILKAKLIGSRHINRLTCNIVIYPKPSYGYYKIRIRYFLPEADFFEALDAVGRHLRIRS